MTTKVATNVALLKALATTKVAISVALATLIAINVALSKTLAITKVATSVALATFFLRIKERLTIFLSRLLYSIKSIFF